MGIFLTRYEVKPYMTKHQTDQLLRAYRKDYLASEAKPLGAHYLDTSASSGVIIIDSPTPEKLNWQLQMVLAYREFVNFSQGVPLLSMQEADQVIGAARTSKFGPGGVQ